MKNLGSRDLGGVKILRLNKDLKNGNVTQCTQVTPVVSHLGNEP